MATNIDSYIECPYFLDHSKRTIACEGLCGTSKTNHIFKTIEEKAKYIASVCSCNSGKSCPHYRAVSLLYERGLRH